MKRAILALVLVALGVGAAFLDVPRVSGKIKGDEATYIAMAFSVAKDFDLKYRKEDYQRFRALYGSGPEGIFLKQSVPPSEGLEYAKPFIYSVAAAPFAAAFGPGGLLLFNGLLLALCFWCAVAFARARAGAVTGVAIGLGFVGASIVPVWAVWQTPELFNFTVVLVAYFLWLYKEVAPSTAPEWLRRPSLEWITVALIGIATFSKPSNAALIAGPVLLAWSRRQWLRGFALGTVFVAVAAGLFGMNDLVTGDWNYQGGDRYYFVSTPDRDRFPFDDYGTVLTDGSPMSTNQANDENILAPTFIRATFPLNAWYFLVGRDAGLIPYFFPGALIALLWLVTLRRSARWQTATAIACAAGALGLLLFAPMSWNGGGGPLGNRYFLSIYPAMLFLLPAGTSLVPALAGLVVGLISVGPILARPFTNSQEPWENPGRWPLRLLPVEFTLINQLPVALDIQRGRVQVSRDPEVFLYYMDDRTYFQEKDGFWVAPGTADIVVRTAEPLTALELRISSRVPNVVTVSIGGSTDTITLEKDQEKTVRLRPKPGVYAVTSYQLLLSITTESGFYPKDFDKAAADTRHLGAFIKPTYVTR